MVGNLVLSLPLSKTGQRTVKMRDSNQVQLFLSDKTIYGMYGVFVSLVLQKNFKGMILTLLLEGRGLGWHIPPLTRIQSPGFDKWI